MDFFLQNYDYINFFSGWAYLLFSVVCFVSWRSHLGRLAYSWMFLFGFFFSLLKFFESLFIGFAGTVQYTIIYGVLLYVAIFAFYMCAKHTYMGLHKDASSKYKKYFKYPIILFALIPLLGLFFGEKFFHFCIFLVMWSPAALLTAYLIYKIFRVSDYEKRNIFRMFILFSLYIIVYAIITLGGIFDLHSKAFIAMMQFLIATIVFLVGSLVFKYFKTAHEKSVKIYEYMPVYWRHIPIGSILFVVLISGMFLSIYYENKTKNTIAKSSDAIVNSVAESISLKFSKSDQLSLALSNSHFIRDAVSSPSKYSKAIINKVFDNYAKIFKVSEVFAVNLKGDIVFHSNFLKDSSGKRVNISNKTYFSQALSKGNAKFFAKGFIGSKEGYFSSNIIKTFGRNSKAGVLIVKDDMEDIKEKLKSYSNIYIVDKNGIVMVADNDIGYFMSLWPFYESKEPDKRSMLLKEVHNKDLITINDELFYVARALINDEGWSVVYFNSLASVGQMKILGLISVSSILIIIVLLFWSLNQSNRIFALALQHKAILSSARSIAIISTDTKGEIVVYGQGAKDITGYTKDEMEKVGFGSVFFDKNDNPVSFLAAIGSSITINNEWKCLRKDGKVIALLMNIVPQFSLNHKLIGYVFSGADITETKKVENELAQQIKFLQTLMDSMPIAVYYKDNQGYLIGCNQVMENIMEMSKDDMIGKSSKDVYFDQKAAIVAMRTDKQITKNMAAISYEKTVNFRKNGQRNLVFYKSAYKKIDGKFGGIIGVIIDVTAERKMQAERDSLQANLIQKNKLASLGELAGSIAHELNNPLSIIIGYAQIMMKDKELNTENKKAIENIYEAAIRSKSIIKNMLEFARSDSSKIQIININDIIEATILIVEKEISKSKIEIKDDLTEENLYASVNPMQIQQVLLNIILNAKDAMPDGGELGIKTFAEDGNFIIEISDTGKGIKKQDIPKIFDPFFTTKDVGKGTGLGLSICYGIINAHKGKISVSSNIGVGTIFTIKLPLTIN